MSYVRGRLCSALTLIGCFYTDNSKFPAREWPVAPDGSIRRSSTAEVAFNLALPNRLHFNSLGRELRAALHRRPVPCEAHPAHAPEGR